MHSYDDDAAAAVISLLRRLDKKRYAPIVACTQYIPELTVEIPSGISVIMPTSEAMRHKIIAVQQLAVAARASHIVFGAMELQSVFWAAYFGKDKAVGWLHQELPTHFAKKSPLYTRAYLAALRWAAARCQFLVCTSHGVFDSARSLIPDATEKLRIIYNPLDVPTLERRATESFPMSLQRCFEKPVILGVGRLVWQKAFHVLIKAHALLLDQGVDHHLCILGEGPERENLLHEVARLNLTESVFMPGFINPFPVMKRASILGVSSISENFSRVIQEALYFGLPVVSTDCPRGPAEILGGGQYGLLVPMSDPKVMATALASMLQPDRAKRFREAGLARSQEFNPQVAMAAWDRIFIETIKKHLVQEEFDA